MNEKLEGPTLEAERYMRPLIAAEGRIFGRIAESWFSNHKRLEENIWDRL